MIRETAGQHVRFDPVNRGGISQADSRSADAGSGPVKGGGT